MDTLIFIAFIMIIGVYVVSAGYAIIWGPPYTPAQKRPRAIEVGLHPKYRVSEGAGPKHRTTETLDEELDRMADDILATRELEQ